jgi:hypothetical protein
VDDAQTVTRQAGALLFFLPLGKDGLVGGHGGEGKCQQ